MSSAPTVLVADDELLLCGLIRRVLEREGFRVLEAREPAAAFDLLATTPEITVALLDMWMFADPEATLWSIRARHSELGLILTSGDLPSPSLREVLEACLCRFLKKPFAPQTLVELVRQELSPS